MNRTRLFAAIRLFTMILAVVLPCLAAFPQNVIQGDWNTQADQYRGQNGQRYTISFPAGGAISGRLWGTDLYTDDSSIATAAVHAGLITPQNGGTVTVEIRGGADAYQGSIRNGVTSNPYGGFTGSFVFVGKVSTGQSSTAIQGTWVMQADLYRGQNGQRYTISFPAGGTLSARLWGTDLYTDDSSIGSAAVHAGLITPQNGGTVTIEIRPGAEAYQGSVRNGVTSNPYGVFTGSFIFIGKGSSGQSAGVLQGNWNMQADPYRGQNGQRYTITFPAGGTLSGRLWGTDLYTDDSSIGAAAVHAGLITLQNGGTVTFEIRPGAEAYQGSVRNGVTSNPFGAFSGSFVFIGKSGVAGGTSNLDLTGLWKDNNGSTYSIRHIGNQIWWYMDAKPAKANVFRGILSGNVLTGEWCDIPGGKLDGNNIGKLSLKVVTPDHLEKTSDTPFLYGGSVWTRIYWDPNR